jgi:hypothetical protein
LDVRSFYNILAIKEASTFPWRSIWCTKAPSKVALFVWTAVLRKILTVDNLGKRNLIVINRCCLRKSDEKTIDHLLLQCEIACSLWYAIFNRFGLSWVMPSSVAGLCACWWTGGRSQSATVWKMVLLYPLVVLMVRKECKMLSGLLRDP